MAFQTSFICNRAVRSNLSAQIALESFLSKATIPLQSTPGGHKTHNPHCPETMLTQLENITGIAKSAKPAHSIFQHTKLKTWRDFMEVSCTPHLVCHLDMRPHSYRFLGTDQKPDLQLLPYSTRHFRSVSSCQLSNIEPRMVANLTFHR